MTFYGVKRGSVVNIQLASNYKKIEMTSEVNLRKNIVHYFTLSLSPFFLPPSPLPLPPLQLASTVFPQEINTGVMATSLSGLLTIKSGQNKLHPLPLPKPKNLWGHTSAQTLIEALKEVCASLMICTS